MRRGVVVSSLSKWEPKFGFTACTPAAVRWCTTTGPCTLLSAEELAVQESVREFARTDVAPLVKQMDEEAKMPSSLIQECHERGLMGIETSLDLGGAGMGFMETLISIEELAKVDPSVAGLVDVQSIVQLVLRKWGHNDSSDSYHSQLQQRLATNAVGSFCLTESGSGSDAFGLKTKAEPLDGGKSFKINGTKIYITNSGEAEIFLVMANVDLTKGYKGITCFAVDAKAHPGVTVGKKENKMGIRASSTCEVHFSDVIVPASTIVGKLGEGYKIAIEALNEGRIGIASQQIGLAQGAFDACMPYLFERKQFNRLIGDFQGMQFQYAETEVELHAARLLTYNAARMQQRGENFVKEAAMAKLYASQVAERTASRAIEWMGGIGFMRDAGVEKYYRDAKIGQIYEGTSNIQLHTIAKFMKDKYASKN